jgi:hypothetical protein
MHIHRTGRTINMAGQVVTGNEPREILTKRAVPYAFAACFAFMPSSFPLQIEEANSGGSSGSYHGGEWTFRP